MQNLNNYVFYHAIRNNMNKLPLYLSILGSILHYEQDINFDAKSLISVLLCKLYTLFTVEMIM